MIFPNEGHLLELSVLKSLAGFVRGLSSPHQAGAPSETCVLQHPPHMALRLDSGQWQNCPGKTRCSSAVKAPTQGATCADEDGQKHAPRGRPRRVLSFEIQLTTRHFLKFRLGASPHCTGSHGAMVFSPADPAFPEHQK